MTFSANRRFKGAPPVFKNYKQCCKKQETPKRVRQNIHNITDTMWVDSHKKDR